MARAEEVIELENLLQCECRLLALLGRWENSDLSPQSGPKRTLDQVAVTNRDFMSTRPNLKACLSSSLQIAHVWAARAAKSPTPLEGRNTPRISMT